MILRLDPAVPVVWRSPSTVQIGVDPVVGVFDGAGQPSERLLAALTVGVPESALPVIAEAAGAGPQFAAALLEAMRPALLPEGGERPPAAPAPSSLRLAIDGDGAVARQLAAVLRALGVRLAERIPDDDDPVHLDAAVLLGRYAIAPGRHGKWLRRDIPHLGVVFGERSARIGPFVDVGAGPCLGCLDRDQAEADPAWPAIAAQLQQRRSPAEAGAFAASVTLRVTRVLLDQLLTGSRELRAQTLELRPDGSEAITLRRPNARCGCRALPESATADVLPLARFPSRSSSGSTAASHG